MFDGVDDNVHRLHKDRKGIDPEDGEYSPTEFYTRRSDKRGLDKELRVGIPPNWHYLAHEMKEEFPEYKTVADLMRDSLVHRLVYLKDQINNPSLRGKVQRAISMAATQARASDRAEFKAYLEQAEEGLKLAVELEDWGGVEDEVDGLRRAADGAAPVLAVKARELADLYEGKVPR